jgi:hypothetical protein
MMVLSMVAKAFVASLPIYCLYYMFPIMFGDSPSIPVDDVPIIVSTSMVACMYMAIQFGTSSILDGFKLVLGFVDDRSKRQK